LRENGHDVVAIGETAPSISDQDVMELAIKNDRTILTFDRDYGELIFKKGYKPEAGVIYLRIEHFLPTEPGRIVHDLVSNQLRDMSRSFVVFDGKDIRRRRY
jgi:predicted nuclease of predicted toxin-antitoxin system